MTIAKTCSMNLSLKVISVLGQATAPTFTFEIIGAVGLIGVMINHLVHLTHPNPPE
jgi:hypothetical protein